MQFIMMIANGLFMNKQLQQQNLRELARLTFLNLMSANGVMAKTIIRNYKQKQERNNEYKRIWSKENLGQ